MENEKQEEAKKQVASLFADTFHNMSKHGLQINMQKQAFQVIWREVYVYMAAVYLHTICSSTSPTRVAKRMRSSSLMTTTCF